MRTTRGYFAALKPASSVPQFVTKCNTVIDKMSNDTHYANPPIPYATALAHVAALDKAEQNVRKNGAADRDAKLAVVRADMRQYKAFVQGLADANLANAQSLIENAGMFASTRSSPAKQYLTARHGATPGQVVLDAKAAKRRATYYWQMRTGQAPWADLPTTVVAKATVDDLTPATVVEFRLRILTRAGYSDWSSPVSIIVH